MIIRCRRNINLIRTGLKMRDRVRDIPIEPPPHGR